MVVCHTYPLYTLKEYRYVVVLSCYQGNILLSRHKARDTWETQGGHIEPGETPLDAARRELYEESGALEFDLRAFCDYRAENPKTHCGANGVVFTAVIEKLGDIPESEMAEVRAFAQLPDALTYPAITPVLFAKLAEEEKHTTSACF